MSVLNRKMFKPRNARNALNRAAGIMPVQKFHAGGPVGHTHQGNMLQRFMNAPNSFSGVFNALRGNNSQTPVSSINAQAINAARNASPTLNARMNVLQGRGTAPLRQTMDAGSGAINLDPSSLSGIGSILSRTPAPKQSIRDFYGGGLKSVVTTPNPMTVGQQTRSDLLEAAATPVDAVVGGVATTMDAIGNLLAPLASEELTPGFVNAVVSGKQTLPDSVKQRINNREISVPTALSEALLSGKVDSTGIDLAKLSGFQKNQEVADVVEIMNAAPGSQTVRVKGESIDDLVEPRKDLIPVDDVDPDAVEIDEQPDFLIETKPTVDDGGEDDATPSTQDGTTTDDVNPKKEIERVINSGTKEEQQSTLDGFIKEFMDKAPGYESANSGLILAKIGFAMAAGKSPNAIENIASAMSDGADMLIKDKAKKDEFNRQLKLSALQYGLTETSKISAEERAVKRADADVVEMVVGQGGTTYKGRNHAEGESVFISKGDLKAGSFPPNILGTSGVTALKNKATANAAALKAALDQKKITPAEYTKQIEKYSKAVTTAIDSESGIALLEGAMVTVTDGNVTGMTGVFKDMVRGGGAFLNMDLSEEYGDKKAVRDAMRAALQDVIPVTLGSTQTANSISNRDVDFLIEAYFGAGALNGGILTFAAETETDLVKRMQRAIGKMRNSQKSAFSTMKTTEQFLTPLLQPGTDRSAASLLSEDQRRLQEAGLRAGGGKGAGVYVDGQLVTTQTGATRGDDGIIRYNLG